MSEMSKYTKKAEYKAFDTRSTPTNSINRNMEARSAMEPKRTEVQVDSSRSKVECKALEAVRTED